MRNCLRILVALALAVMSLASLGGVAEAATGAISGTVSLTGGGNPLGAYIVVLTPNSETPVASAHAIGSGAYTISGLEPGSYWVKASFSGRLTEYFAEQNDIRPGDRTPTSVDVLDGQTHESINFTLDPGSTISGTITADNGTLLENIHIVAYENVSGPVWTWYTDTYSGADGTYVLPTGTEAGAYKLKAEGPGYMGEFWDAVDSLAAATPIDVPALGDNGTKDFALSPCGFISGTVHGVGGTGLQTAQINVYENHTAPGTWVMERWAHTGSNPVGYYFANVASGYPYKIMAWVPEGGYQAQWWENATSVSNAAAIDVTGLAENPGKNFNLLPAAQTAAATDVAETVATLNANLAADVIARPNMRVFFQYGTQSGVYAASTATRTMATVGPFSENLTGLNPGTTYYFRAVCQDSGAQVPGPELSLTTSSPGSPSVTTDNYSSLASISVTLNGTLTGMGTAASVVVLFEYGTVSGTYTSFTDNQTLTAAQPFSASLTGLTAGTTYYFRAKAIGAGDPAYGLEKSFNTLAQPAVQTGGPSNLAATSVTLNGNLESMGTASSVVVSFEWNVSGGSIAETATQTLTAAGAFSVTLTGLTDGTIYYFRAKADGDGVAVFGAQNSFTTPAIDRTGPSISEIGCSGITSSGATIEWVTDEASTSQVEYGTDESYGSTTTIDAGLVKTHSVELTGLEAGKTYHYRVVSKDAANNQTRSDDETFATSGSGGMPAWAWVLIGLAVVGLVGGGAFFAKRRMSKTKPDAPAAPPA